MGKVFVPYVNDAPAAIEIKGHRVLIIGTNPEDVIIDLDQVGGNKIQELQYLEDAPEDSETFVKLAESAQAGVVLTPPGVSMKTMIRNLETQLPWLH